MAGEYVYSLESLTKQHAGKTILDDINLSFFFGARIGVIGSNGSGKSSLLKIMAGIDGEFIGNCIIAKNKSVGYLAQEPSIFGKLSVEDNLKIVLETIIPDKDEQDELINQLLTEFNISHIRDNLGAGLSGGERRRVEICRTLALKPDFVLLDEPFAGVDPIAVEDIHQMIISLKKQKIGVLITDHNVRETLSITDRSYLLYGGKILKSGNAQTLANDEEVRRIYLGKNFKLDQ